jgi:tripartite-type tricarboxylate transporter receptor subunit TctC
MSSQLGRIVSLAAIACCALGAAWTVAAQTAAYPSRVVRFITPFPPGGSLDPLTRMSAQKLSETWGQPTIVENRPGGNSIIGTQAVAKAPADGYTILVAGTPHVINPSLFPTPYDAIKDFAPIATIARSRQILVVNPSLPVKTLRELIALAKARPGELNYGSSGTGNTNHLAGELLSSLAGIRMQHIPYKGAGPAIVDLLTGQLQLSFHVPISVIGHIKSARLRPIAISGETRAAALPQVPTMTQAGLPAFEMSGWTGLFAPAGAPKPIIDKISADMAKVLAMPDIVERLVSQGLEPFISTPEQFAALLQSDMAKFAKLIRERGIKVEN